MFRFFIRRIWHSVPTLIGVTLIAFLLIRLIPGDPVQLMLGERGGSPEVLAEMRHNLGLDRPLVAQYFQFVFRAVRGDLGNSIISQRPVWSEFRDRFPATVELSAVAMVWSILVGIPVGVIAALKRRKWLD